MLSIKKCDEILSKNEKKYTLDQVEKIREYLYQIAGIIYEVNIKEDEEFRRKESDIIS
jgi:hypothetical protein